MVANAVFFDEVHVWPTKMISPHTLICEQQVVIYGTKTAKLLWRSSEL